MGRRYWTYEVVSSSLAPGQVDHITSLTCRRDGGSLSRRLDSKHEADKTVHFIFLKLGGRWAPSSRRRRRVSPCMFTSARDPDGDLHAQVQALAQRQGQFAFAQRRVPRYEQVTVDRKLVIHRDALDVWHLELFELADTESFYFRELPALCEFEDDDPVLGGCFVEGV